MDIRAPRYTDVPLPPYRYRPGEHPHPTAHRDGYSYRPPGAPAPNVRYRAPEQWRQSRDYLYGCDLYNHAYWWEAHEAWEGLWQLTDKTGVQGRFLQGLIQVSACHLKAEIGHWRGVGNLRARSGRYLEFVLAGIDESTFMGLNLRQWHRAADRYLARLLEPGGDRRHDPAAYPYLVLEMPASGASERLGQGSTDELSSHGPNQAPQRQ